MSDFSEKQVDELLEWMPALMTYLRKRSEANDADAKALFDVLDSYCWHQPICAPGVICAGGKPRAKPFCPRCNGHHEREGDAEERCQRETQFARADHRRRGGVE
jgi:CDGSH-type Zn-finger protein